MLETLDFYNLAIMNFIITSIVFFIGIWLFKTIYLNNLTSLLLPSSGKGGGEDIKNLLKGFEMRQAKANKKSKKQTPAPSSGGIMDVAMNLMNNPEVMKMVGNMLSPPTPPTPPPPKPKK